MSDRMEPHAVVQKFIDCINAGDVHGLAGLMTEDHCFIDAVGARHPGRDAMIAGWRGYFGVFPDYRITVENTVASDDVVAAFGWAEGSFHGDPAKAWKFPAAFRGTVRDGKVAEWRVYADIEPMVRSTGVGRFEGAGG